MKCSKRRKSKRCCSCSCRCSCSCSCSFSCSCSCSCIWFCSCCICCCTHSTINSIQQQQSQGSVMTVLLLLLCAYPLHCTVPKEIYFPWYNMKRSRENLTVSLHDGLRGIVHMVSCFPLHFMLCRGNLDYFSGSVYCMYTLDQGWAGDHNIILYMCMYSNNRQHRDSVCAEHITVLIKPRSPNMI